MRFSSELKLPSKLSKRFLADSASALTVPELKIKVPEVFVVEPLVDGAAILWAEALRRNKTKLHIEFEHLPERPYDDDSVPSFLTSSFGFALASQAKTFGCGRSHLDPSRIFSLLDLQFKQHQDILVSRGMVSIICQMPYALLPRPIRVQERKTFSTRSQLESLLGQSLFRFGYRQQLSFGMDDLTEFLFQALKNAFEEHEACRKGGLVRGVYAITLRSQELIKLANQKGGNHDKAFCLSITDLGRGIQNSVRPFASDACTDSELVAYAFRPGVTSKNLNTEEKKSGFGLLNLWEACCKLDAILIVESASTVNFAQGSADGVEGPRFEEDTEILQLGFGTTLTAIWKA